MAESVLKAILLQELQPDVLIAWLSGENQQRSAKLQFSCSVGEFASYFLNYIHEDAPSYDDESSNRTVFTPKGIRSLDRDKRNGNSRLTAVKRRPALFSDQKLAHSQTCPLVTSKSDATNHHQYDESKHSTHTSTPKLMKINSDSVLDNSYASPVSPLYTRNSLNTPRNRNSEKNLCLGDFIVHKKNSSKKKAQRSLCDVTNESKKLRRINPTNLNEKRFSGGFKETGNSFNFKNDFVELAVENLDDQRNLLAEERLKIKNNIDDLVKTTNILKLQSFNSKIEIIPRLDRVDFTSQLDNLIKTYVFLLNNDFILNLTSEMQFLMSLLLSRQYASENLNDSDSEVQTLARVFEDRRDVFKTVHNCVYFAIGALQTQSNLLRCLDRPTLKLLLENERVKTFSPEFHEELLRIYHSKLEQTTQGVVETTQSNVCFMSDTDNRENFATDASFHAFRKQRDLFYEILRIWEQNYYLSGWNFGMALGGKIKTLLNLHGDPVNYRHFARLFKMQLLTSCRQVNSDEAIAEEQANSILTTLPNVDADKLHRLKTRLTTKQDHTDLNSTPTFTGQQEFYKDFILTSWTCHNFLRHLQDSLVSEIVRINENIFDDLSDSEENNVNFTTRNAYSVSMKNLRILAKFLGFIESLPYKMDFRVATDKVLRAEIEIRKWYRSPIDLKSLLVRSLENKTLIATIPWVCKYIAMLDYVTIRLPYFNDVMKILFQIYRSTDVRRNDGPIYNWGLIRLSLGWLFELPHFPSEFYFSFVSKSNCSNLKLFDGCEMDAISSKRQKRLCLDALDIVDQTILYTFCPYLEGFRKLLLSTNASNAGNGVKHITPLTAVENSNDLTEKKLKNQLEEAFFNCQPISVRKTVEFISERVASSCVKHICNKTVPEYKKASLERARKALERVSDTYTCDGESESKLEYVLKNKINELSVTYLKELQEICAKETKRLTSERIPLTLNALLAVDELEQTKETCVAITNRLCIERVQQWIDSHVNIGLFNKLKMLHGEILKSLECAEKEAKEKPVFQLPGCGRDVQHNFDSLNAVKVVEIIRKISIDLIDLKPVDNTSISDLIKSIRKTAIERCDVNNQILSLINRMLVDLMLIIITHKSEYFNDNLEPFIDHWKTFIKSNEDHFKTIICPRNVMLIAQSKDVLKSWSQLSRFIVKLLEIDLLNCETFEAQCVSIYQQEWDEITLKHLSTCFRDVIDEFQRKKPNAAQFSSMLGFVSSYCSQMEF